MAKKVRYNGSTESYYGCSDPSVLVKGRIYEVVHEEVLSFRTRYYLKGIDGYFDSTWFNLLVYNAFSHYIPKVTERYECTRLNTYTGGCFWEKVVTSPIKFVSNRGNNLFHVITESSEYYVNVQ